MLQKAAGVCAAEGSGEGSLESRDPQNRLHCWPLPSPCPPPCLQALLPMNEEAFSWRCQGLEGAASALDSLYDLEQIISLSWVSLYPNSGPYPLGDTGFLAV